MGIKKRGVLGTLPIIVVVAFVLFILLLFAIPNVDGWQARAEATRAVSEINSMELAFTKMLSDAGQSSLCDLFEPEAFDDACSNYALLHSVDAFEASVVLYTRATYTLFRKGRGALVVETDDPVLVNIQQALREDVVRNLGTDYMSEFGDDPWGNPYQVFPGPWPDDMGPVLLRTYLEAPDSNGTADSLTIGKTDETSEQRGFPARRETEVFIWSFGANDVSDQPRYDATHEYAPPARSHYRKGATEEYLGGGDDINNWDRNQTFMRFYN